jgi:hypothetical protein
MNPYTESVLRLCDTELANPRYVNIDEDRLKYLATELAVEDLDCPQWREDVFPQDDDDVFIDFLVVSSAINYCFTRFSDHAKYEVEYPFGSGRMWSGAMGMLAALKRALDDGMDILNPRFLAEITEDQVEHILRATSVRIPMMGSRWANLQALGDQARKQGVVNFADIFRDADFRAFNEGRGVAERLYTDFCRSYRDVTLWCGQYEIRFAKRAQLVPMMYQGRAISSGGKLPLLKDPQSIGPLADYQVPHGLRFWNVIEYSPELAERVDNGQIIHPHSHMELEIRAIGCVKAMVMLLERVNELRLESGQPLTTMAELDNSIWRMGRSAPGRHHYTYTTAY